MKSLCSGNRWLVLLSFCCTLAAVAAIESSGIGHKKILSVLLVSYRDDSDAIQMAALGDALVRRGHNVTFCTTERERRDFQERLAKRTGMRLLSVGSEWREGVKPMHSLVRELIETAKRIENKLTSDPSYASAWDIIVASSFYEATISCLSMQWRLPLVLFSPSLNPSDILPPWPYPYALTGYDDNPTLSQRFSLLSLRMLFDLFGWYVWQTSTASDCSEHYHRITSRVSTPRLVASAIGFEYSRPVSPATHYVGAMLFETGESLDEELMEWLETKNDYSIVYISMGTRVKLTKSMGDALINGLLQTNFSILWSLPESNRDILEGYSLDRSRFYISHWLPQQVVLRHQAIALTIMHGGHGGISQALINAVPLIVIPFDADQPGNAARVQQTGAGVRPDKESLTAQKILKAVETATSPKYKKAAKKLQKIFQHAGGAERAADLVEFYEEVGYEHLIPAYAKYKWSWVQYYNIDVYALIIAVTLAGALAVYKAFRCVRGRCCKEKTKLQ